MLARIACVKPPSPLQYSLKAAAVLIWIISAKLTRMVILRVRYDYGHARHEDTRTPLFAVNGCVDQDNLVLIPHLYTFSAVTCFASTRIDCVNPPTPACACLVVHYLVELGVLS